MSCTLSLIVIAIASVRHDCRICCKPCNFSYLPQMAILLNSDILSSTLLSVYNYINSISINFINAYNLISYTLNVSNRCATIARLFYTQTFNDITPIFPLYIVRNIRVTLRVTFYVTQISHTRCNCIVHLLIQLGSCLRKI